MYFKALKSLTPLWQSCDSYIGSQSQSTEIFLEVSQNCDTILWHPKPAPTAVVEGVVIGVSQFLYIDWFVK